MQKKSFATVFGILEDPQNDCKFLNEGNNLNGCFKNTSWFYWSYQTDLKDDNKGVNGSA